MDLPELQRRLDRLVKLDLGPFYEAYRAHGGDDIDGFLAHLGVTKALDPTLLKELAGMTEVETPSLDDPAYQGTLLAAWAKTAVPAGGARTRGGPTAAPGAAQAPATDVHFRAISRLGKSGARGVP